MVNGEFVGRTCAFAVNAEQGSPIYLILTYRSMAPSESVLGNNWDHNFNIYLEELPSGDIRFHNGAGRTYDYTIEGSTFKPPVGIFNTLEASSTTGYTITSPNGAKQMFDTDGRITASLNTNGHGLTWIYTGGLLTRLTDAHDRNYDLTYDSSDRLISFASFDGREVTIEYDSSGNLVKVNTPGDSNDPIYTSSFTYDSMHRLLTAEDNNGFLYLTNTYDLQGRIVEQDVGGSIYNIDYDPVGLKTSITDPNGNQRAYFYEGPLRPVPWMTKIVTNRGIDPTEPEFFATYFVHDADLRRVGVLNPRGNFDFVIYDSGNEDIRARGNVISTIKDPGGIPDPTTGQVRPPVMSLFTYEPVFNLVKTATDARGLDPTYTPDNGGPNTPERYTTTFYYDYEEATLGDINGDGTTSQASGNLIAIQAPMVNRYGNPNAAMMDSSAYQVSTRTMTYDADGRLILVTQPAGNKQAIEYYPTNGISGDATDREGFIKSITMDHGTGIDPSTGDSYVNSLTVYDYDENGRLISQTDGNGNTWTSTYDDRDRLVQTEAPSPFGYLKDYGYDKNDNPTTVSVDDDNGGQFVHSAEYDGLDRVSKKNYDASRPSGFGTGAIESETEFYYDSNGNLALVRSPRAVSGEDFDDVMSFIYTERNLLSSVSQGGVLDDFDQATCQNLPSGAAVPVVCVAKRQFQLSTSVDPSDLSSMTFRRDENGNACGAVGSRGFATVNGFDGLDRLVLIKDGNGHQKRFSHHSDGRVSEYVTAEAAGAQILPVQPCDVTDAMSHGPVLGKAVLKYDERGQQYEYGVLMNDPSTGLLLPTEGLLTPFDGFASQITEFDRNSRPIRVIDDNVNDRTYVYDGASQLRQTMDAVGNYVQMAWDGAGNPTQVVSVEMNPSGTPKSYTTTFAYDELHRLISTTDAIGNTNSVTYDRHGRIIEGTDARGNTINYVRDGLGRVWETNHDLRVGGTGTGSVTDTITTKIEWDANSNVVKRIDDNGQATTMEYDSRNRLVSITMADATKYEFLHDGEGNLVQFKDPNGNVVMNSFDAASKLTRRDISPGLGVVGTTEQQFVYNGIGQVVATIDNNDPGNPLDDVVLTAAYDSMGHIIRGTTNGLPLARTFDGVGNLLTMTSYSGHTTTRSYDAVERVTSIGELVGEPIVSYEYLGPDKLNKISLQNGVEIVNLFDSNARLVSSEATKGIAPLTRVSYAYDEVHNVVSRNLDHHAEDGHVFTFDSIDRMIELERGFLDAPGTSIATPASDLQKQVWDLDGVNNWAETTRTIAGTDTTESRTHSTVNQVTGRTVGSTTTPYEYDANGNLIADGVREYQYDFANRLVSVTDADGPVAVYTYDTSGRRMAKTTPAMSEVYLYSGSALIEVRNATTMLPKMQFTYGVNGPVILDVVATVNGVTSGNLHVRLFYHTDAQGSILGVSDANGNLVEGYSYDVYGTRTVYQAGPNGVVDYGGDDIITIGGPSAVGNPLGYIGRWHDDETGFIQMGARYYNPETAVFLTQDPLGVWGDPLGLGNAYTYTGGNPASRSDPSGLSAARMMSSSSQPRSASYTATDYQHPTTVVVPCPSQIISQAPSRGTSPPDASARGANCNSADGAACEGLAVISLGGCNGGEGQAGCNAPIIVSAGGCNGGNGVPGGDGGYGCNGVLIVSDNGCTGGHGGDGCHGADGTRSKEYIYDEYGQPYAVEHHYEDAEHGCNGGSGGAGCKGGVAVSISESCQGGNGGRGGDGGNGYDCYKRSHGCRGGQGGNGGDGGRGGDGCNTFASVSLDTSNCVGGNGGRGGNGGAGGSGPIPCGQDTACSAERGLVGGGACLLVPGPWSLVCGGAVVGAYYIWDSQQDKESYGNGGLGGNGGQGGHGCTGFHVGPGCTGGLGGNGGNGGASGGGGPSADNGNNGNNGYNSGGGAIP